MPVWTEVDWAYEPYADGSQTFVASRDGFAASSLAKTGAAADSRRQGHFERLLLRLSEETGPKIAVFVSFAGARRRMDKGCVGHAVARGFLAAPENGPEGYVTRVALRRGCGPSGR